MRKNYDREKIIWDSKFSTTDKILLLALNSFVDANGECFPGQELLARMCGFSDRTIRNRCNYLERVGVIQRSHRTTKRGHRTSDQFKVCFDAVQSFLPEIDSARNNLPENSSGRKSKKQTKAINTRGLALPENNSGRKSLPENGSKPTGNSRPSLPENDDQTYRKEVPGNYPVLTTQYELPREREEKSLTQKKVFCDETNVSTEQPSEPIDAEIINTTPVNNQDSGGDKSSAAGAIAISNNSQYSSVQRFESLMSVTAETHPWRFANRDELRLFRQYLANTSLKFIKDKNERIGTARQWLSNASSAVPGEKRYAQVYDAWEDWLDSLETATHIDDVTAASKDSTRRMLSRFSEYQKNREAELAEKRRAHEELLERSRRENF